MANEPSVSLSHQRIQTHLPNSFLTGLRPVDACRTLYHLTGSFLSVEVKRRRTNFSSISGKFSCSLANGRKLALKELLIYRKSNRQYGFRPSLRNTCSLLMSTLYLSTGHPWTVHDATIYVVLVDSKYCYGSGFSGKDSLSSLSQISNSCARELVDQNVMNVEDEKDDAEVVTACSWNELVLSSDVPVVVEFWTSWCGPCKMVSRLMNELANDYSGRIRCFRINADDYPQVAASNGVERIPTILVFKDAEKLERITGTLPKSVYVAAIQKSLSE
ncbi:hypothetical protein M5K25_020697 [Dendrobium thyrsiflorum]|uniref:Thioredoxin domain-containing protein n=1 Tax=Dendrobium thyrsiflorum TaxID=117978 RepID=A0ABD0UAL1_DENTH